MPARADACCRRVVVKDQLRDCVVVGCLLQVVMVQIRWGRAGLVPAAGHPLAQQVWAWSGAVGTTRGQSIWRPRRLGVRQNGDRARVASGVLTLPWGGQARGYGRRAA